DAEAGLLAGESASLRREPLLMADLVEQVGGIAAIEDAEAGIEPDARGMLAQQARADCVKGAGPGQAEGDRWAMPRAAARVPARRIISCAARRENVSRAIRSGATPAITRCATRWASMAVLPVPAPAMTSCGPARNRPSGACSPQPAAARWAVLSASSQAAPGTCPAAGAAPAPAASGSAAEAAKVVAEVAPVSSSLGSVRSFMDGRLVDRRRASTGAGSPHEPTGIRLGYSAACDRSSTISPNSSAR